MIRSLLIIVYVLLAVSRLHSQDRLKDYTFKQSDTGWRVYYYVRTGPLAKMESFKDKKKTIAHGRFAWYDEYGMVDSSGLYIDGQRDGLWLYYNDKNRVIRKKDYAAGVLTGEKEYPAEAELKNNGRSNEANPDENAYIESEFEGGSKGWQFYLTRNLRYPIDAIKAGVQGTVRIAFSVDQLGEVSDPWVFKSVSYLLDQEAQRLIAKSPRWEPANRNGERVKSYKIQAISFRAR
jgi:periplasmic protein TonB